MALEVRDIARMIDHSLLHPTVTDNDTAEGCRLADRYAVASVCVKPYAVNLAAEALRASEVAVGTVVGFPHGNSRTDLKVREAEAAMEDGARELDMVINGGKVIGGDWAYVEEEIRALVEAAHARHALLKVIFENDFLTDDELKIRLCGICGTAGADFVKTSTGFGFVKQPGGMYQYAGATEADVRLMRRHTPEQVAIKAAGGVRTLDELLKFRELGVTRVGATATQAILDEAAKRYGA